MLEDVSICFAMVGPAPVVPEMPDMHQRTGGGETARSHSVVSESSSGNQDEDALRCATDGAPCPTGAYCPLHSCTRGTAGTRWTWRCAAAVWHIKGSTSGCGRRRFQLAAIHWQYASSSAHRPRSCATPCPGLGKWCQSSSCRDGRADGRADKMRLNEMR